VLDARDCCKMLIDDRLADDCQPPGIFRSTCLISR
jgi:hypothetical protein